MNTLRGWVIEKKGLFVSMSDCEQSVFWTIPEEPVMPAAALEVSAVLSFESYGTA